MSALNRLSRNDMNHTVLPTEDQLKDMSYKVSLCRSTNKLLINDDIINCVLNDVKGYTIHMIKRKYGYVSRVKSVQSIINKISRSKTVPYFQNIFNDILGIRLLVQDYNLVIPNYFRIVDMSKGKYNDDGYRAIHLYYKLDNYHYQIEVQLWSENDYNFNLWSHSLSYKSNIDSNILLMCRSDYDNGFITCEDDFRRSLCIHSKN